MPGDTVLVEEMIADAVVDLLIGVTRDPAHGFVLTLAAGGTLTELLQDSATLLLPTTEDAVAEALATLRVAALIDGYRGAPAAPVAPVAAAVRAVQSYVVQHRDRIEELEINPLIVTPTRAVAADVLIRRQDARET